MLHLINKNFAPKDASFLLRKARDLCIGFNAIIRDARISSKYLEFDISVPKNEIELLIDRLKPIGKVDHARQIIEEKTDKIRAIKLGVSYFNSERFWESHEVLEGVWKNCFEGEKDLVQGIILTAAAFVHHQKNEDSICLSILNRALEKLSKSDGKYYDIDVDSLRNKIQDITSSKIIRPFKI